MNELITDTRVQTKRVQRMNFGADILHIMYSKRINLFQYG